MTFLLLRGNYAVCPAKLTRFDIRRVTRPCAYTSSQIRSIGDEKPGSSCVSRSSVISELPFVWVEGISGYGRHILRLYCRGRNCTIRRGWILTIIQHIRDTLAFVRAPRKLGMAMAAKIPIMATTIKSSIKVKPSFSLMNNFFTIFSHLLSFFK